VVFVFCLLYARCTSGAYTATYPTVLTIVHLDGTSILSLYIGDQRRDNWLLRTYYGKEKAMAQGRRRDIGSMRNTERHWAVGDYCDEIWGRESVLEVGGAYLFETLQSGVRKIPRLPDATNDDVYYDSGAYHTDNAHCKLREDDNSAHYTGDARYEPNTSRRRGLHSQQRQPRADNTTTVRSHVESVRPVREPRNDWREIWGLSHALIFETLRLVLIVSITTIRVGTVLAERAGRWLDEEVLRALKHKRNWIGAKE
jgi:hypothetical protein